MTPGCQWVPEEGSKTSGAQVLCISRGRVALEGGNPMLHIPAGYTDNVSVRVGLHHIMQSWVGGHSEGEARGMTPDPGLHYMV